jgi:hypothetical protein
MNENITQERAAQRFHQMQSIEFALIQKTTEIGAAKSHLKDLKEEREGLLAQLRAAARDEGDLPLFNL